MNVGASFQYGHARRWAPGFDVPYLIPPFKICTEEGLAGLFDVDADSYACIYLSDRFLHNPKVFALTLVHEACHDILMQSELRHPEERLSETTTDLAMFVCGFGELAMRGHFHVEHYQGVGSRRTHFGYLTSEQDGLVHECVEADFWSNL